MVAAACRTANHRLFGGEGEGGVRNHSATQERLPVRDGARTGRGFELLGGCRGQEPRAGKPSRFRAHLTDGGVQMFYG